jgi:hypothetical protein
MNTENTDEKRMRIGKSWFLDLCSSAFICGYFPFSVVVSSVTHDGRQQGVRVAHRFGLRPSPRTASAWGMAL